MSELEQNTANGCFDLANEFIEKIRLYKELSFKEKGCMYDLFIIRAKRHNRFIHPEANRIVLEELYG